MNSFSTFSLKKVNQFNKQGTPRFMAYLPEWVAPTCWGTNQPIPQCDPVSTTDEWPRRADRQDANEHVNLCWHRAQYCSSSRMHTTPRSTRRQDTRPFFCCKAHSLCSCLDTTPPFTLDVETLVAKSLRHVKEARLIACLQTIASLQHPRPGTTTTIASFLLQKVTFASCGRLSASSWPTRTSGSYTRQNVCKGTCWN